MLLLPALAACGAAGPLQTATGAGTPTPEQSPPTLVDAPGWSAVLIAEGDYRDPFLQVDAAAVARAVATLDGRVYVLTDEGGNWSRERLSDPGPDGTDRHPVLAIGDGDLAWITFARTGCVDICPGPPDEELVEGLYLLALEGGAWALPRPLADCYCPDYSLAASADGELQLAYVAGDPIDDVARLRHLTLAGDVVTDERLTRDGHQPSLALAAGGLARLAFVAGTELAPDGLRYATGAADGSFSIDAGPSRQATDRGPILLGAESGAPVVVWTRTGEGGGIYRSTREGDGWSQPQSLIGAFSATSAAIGEGDALHLTALGGAGVLLYARYGDGPPITTELAFPVSAASLALDSTGRPHVLLVTGRDDDTVAHRLYYLVGPSVD